MFFKHRSRKADSEDARDTLPARRLAEEVLGSAGLRVTTPDPARGALAAAEAVGLASGWSAGGAASAVILTDTELGQVRNQLRLLVDRRLSLLVVVVVSGDLNAVFEAGQEGSGVLIGHRGSESAALIQAGLLAAGRLPIPVLAVIPDSPGAGVDASKVGPESRQKRPLLDALRPFGSGARQTDVRGVMAEHVYLHQGLGATLDECLTDAGLTLAGKPRRAALAVGWVPRETGPHHGLMECHRLFPPPAIEAPEHHVALVAFPASPRLVGAWCGEASLKEVAVCVTEMGTMTDGEWQRLVKDAAAGSLPPVCFHGPTLPDGSRLLPPEIQERNRGAAETLGASLRPRVWTKTVKDSEGDGSDAPSSDRLSPGLRGNPDLEEFWRSDGYARRQGRLDDLLPNKAEALARMPAGASAAVLPAPIRAQGPVVHPRSCTGCGACSALCPEMAIRPRVLRFDRILADGMAAAGALPTHLPRLIRPLGTLCERLFRDDGLGQYPTLTLLVAEALERLLPKTRIAKETYDEVRQELAKLDLPELPLVPAFDSFDRALYLGIDADRCTGCGLCEQACEEGAISMRGEGTVYDPFDVSIPEMEALDLPKMHSDGAANRLSGVPAVFPFGGSPGLTLALRQSLGALAGRETGNLRRLAEHVRALRHDLEAAVQKTLTSAAHIHDFDALAERLDEVDSGSIDRAAVLGKAPPLETKRFRSLTEARARLADVTPDQRSPLTLILADELTVPTYPNNPFAFPWISAPGHPASFSRGVLAETRDRVRAMAERISSAEPLVASRPSFGATDEIARILTTRLVILCSRVDDQLLGLLSEDLPVTVLLLAQDPVEGCDAALAVAVRGLCPVAQVSPVDPDHLVKSLEHLAGQGGPSFAAVHVPADPIETLLPSARATISSGVWTLFLSDADGHLEVQPVKEDGVEPSLTSLVAWISARQNGPSEGSSNEEMGLRTARRLLRIRDRILEMAHATGTDLESDVPSAPVEVDGAGANSEADRSAADPLSTLTARLLELSGFGAGGAAASRRLEDFADDGGTDS